MARCTWPSRGAAATHPRSCGKSCSGSRTAWSASTVANPVAGLAGLTFAVAAYLFIEGVLEFILSFQLRPRPGTGWLLVDGVITLILAVMIWSTWPSSAAWVVGTLIGISMFFSGLTRLMLSAAVRRAVAQ